MSPPSPDVIRSEIRRRAEEIVEWTKTLIRFPSENRPPDGAEAEAQKFIEAECKKLHLPVDVFAPDEIPGIQEHSSWLPGRDYAKGRKNVVARLAGRGNGKSLLFSGHVDVAPFEPDAWNLCRPYDPVLKNGRLYGRGTADMKGGLAAAFWALKILRELEFQPDGEILFESLVDEEFAGGNGTLSARLRGCNADLAIIPEPTQMQICPACFGAFLGEMTISGSAGMPYTGTAIANPIHGAARAVELFSEWQRQWRGENRHRLFQKAGKELNVLVWKIDSIRPGEFTQMGTPLETRLSWIVWVPPGTTEEAFEKRFRAFWEERFKTDSSLSPFDIRWEKKYHYVKPWETPAENPAVRAVVKAFETYGIAPILSGAPFSCDLGIYGEVGNMPCLLVGPRGGNLHAPDEWVHVEDIFNLTGILANLAVTWCCRS
jgi:acetylornithine deacetylase